MREICLAKLDKTRPVLVLTRELARGTMSKVTVAPVTSRVKGMCSEVPLDARKGLDQPCVASLDNVLTIPASGLGRTLRLPEGRSGTRSGTGSRPRVLPPPSAHERLSACGRMGEWPCSTAIVRVLP